MYKSQQDACTQGTGCGHDADHVWTGDDCEPTFVVATDVYATTTVVGTTTSGSDVVQVSVNVGAAAANVYTIFGRTFNAMSFTSADRDTSGLGSDT